MEPFKDVNVQDEIYREHILDHYKNPRHFGGLLQCDLQEKGLNPVCGDQVEVFVNLDDQQNLKEVSFKGRGCAISQASTSMLLESIEEKSAQDVLRMTQEDILNLLGITLGVTRVKCAMLGLRTLQKALMKILH